MIILRHVQQKRSGKMEGGAAQADTRKIHAKPSGRWACFGTNRSLLLGIVVTVKFKKQSTSLF
ncbi:MAG: hypothetical protein EOO25_00175 [Comamonadaceae bacterium]|nr:MAG: hypothetical protein EOO25_00175 [Comamonadaceae bacterium]